MIEAIDYKTGEIVWKISEEFEGKIIKPYGICHDDVGNLYIAHGTNNKVLVVSLDGEIKQNDLHTIRTFGLDGLNHRD